MLVSKVCPSSRQIWRKTPAVPATVPTAIRDRPAAFYQSIKTYNTRTCDSSLSQPSPFIPALSILSPRIPLQSTTSRALIASRRTFHSSSLFEQSQKPEDVRDPPRSENSGPETESSTKSDGAAEGESKNSESDSAKEENKEQQDKKDAPPPPPPHGDKSPWQVFRETLSAEFKSSKEWNESTKQLGGAVQQFTESDAVRRAREMSDAASSGTSKTVKAAGKVIGHSAAWTWETPMVQGIRKGVNATGRGIEKATRPVRETKAFKEISKAVDDGSSSRYGGWIEKEERRKQKELRDMKEAQNPTKAENFEEDPNAGTNITVHKDAAWKESWNSFKDSSKVMQGIFNLKSVYNESENPLITTARSITDRFAGFFAENETAMVIKKFREMDPNFQLDPFMREMREYILPEVLDAYVKGDTETLKLWLSAAQFQVYSALTDQYTKAGLKSDGKILDIRHVDILNARMLEPGEIPVFIITCRTQEVHVYRNAKTGDLAAGMEDKVQLVTYAIGVTRIPEDVNNPETRGWRLIELQKAARDYL